MDRVIKKESRPSKNNGKHMTPGGFHSLEYRWSLCESFEWMNNLGRGKVYQRVHDLNRQCKEGLASLSHVILHTPLKSELSSGIISFEIKGMRTEKAVEKLREKKIVATAAPYKKSWIRFTPGIINTEEEINKALNVVNDLK
jgi:selenocysteine lyase/cysteine desulfurase